MTYDALNPGLGPESSCLFPTAAPPTITIP
jgi:hypothetical protein